MNSINKYWEIIADGINEHSKAPKIELRPMSDYKLASLLVSAPCEDEEENLDQEPDMDWADPTRER